ncbi:MAG: putative zinc-binding protein [Methanomassiliicoccales archaeon]|nr:MAG: putative zinc-binding protein [Methanomassiliicoccales archaeon]
MPAVSTTIIKERSTMSMDRYWGRPMTVEERERPRPTVFACSGSANVGQLANSCALRAESEGLALFACIASIGCHEEKMLDLARRSPKIVALDGCPISCCSRSLEHAGFRPTARYVMTDTGLIKDHCKLPSEKDIERAMTEVRKLLL